MLEVVSPAKLPIGVGGHIVGETFQVLEDNSEELKEYTVVGLCIKSNRGSVYTVEIGQTGEETELSETEMWKKRQ